MQMEKFHIEYFGVGTHRATPEARKTPVAARVAGHNPWNSLATPRYIYQKKIMGGAIR
jgi:hypothetical protein